MKKYVQGLVVVLLFMGCNKGDDNLPEETREGRGTMGFYLNGRKIIPNFQFAVKGLNYYGGAELIIGAIQYHKSLNSDEYLELIISGYSIEEGKIYRLGAFSDSLGAYGEFAYFVDTAEPGVRKYKEYYTSSEHFGELTISKYDPDLQIISGVFWFDVWTEERSVLSMREGRFDLKYKISETKEVGDEQNFTKYRNGVAVCGL